MAIIIMIKSEKSARVVQNTYNMISLTLRLPN
jgi:hypothetical protein